MRLAKERSTIERTAQTALVGTVSEVPFYVPDTDLPARPRYTLKHGDSFLMLDSHGDIGAASGGSDGFFHHDTRFVSRFELRFNDMPPLLLGSSVRDDDSASSADLTRVQTHYTHHARAAARHTEAR